jgi:hypothetical protein
MKLHQKDGEDRRMEYGGVRDMVGPNGLEPSTSSVST